MTIANTDVLDEQTRARYLARLGVDHVPAPTVDTLRHLHLAHLERVPFENLDLHTGRRVELDLDRFLTKIVDEHRGGFCYELNGAFAALLRSLGFAVDLLEARVHGADGPLRPFDHLCLLVGLGVDRTNEHLADVGFGDSFVEPIPFVAAVEHLDRAGVFRLGTVDDAVDDATDGAMVDLVRDGEAQYRVWRRPRRLADFAPGCRFHQSPESHFTRGPLCTRRTPDGRVTLSGSTLIHTRNGRRSEVAIGVDQLGPTLRRELGVDLPDDVLARLTATVWPTSDS